MLLTTAKNQLFREIRFTSLKGKRPISIYAVVEGKFSFTESIRLGGNANQSVSSSQSTTSRLFLATYLLMFWSSSLFHCVSSHCPGQFTCWASCSCCNSSSVRTSTSQARQKIAKWKYMKKFKNLKSYRKYRIKHLLRAS